MLYKNPTWGQETTSLSLLLISPVSLLRALVRTYTIAATELMYRPEFRNLSLNVQVSTAMYLWIYPRLRLDHWIRVLLRSALLKFCKHLPCIYCVVNEYFIFPNNNLIRRELNINLMLYVYIYAKHSSLDIRIRLMILTILSIGCAK